MRLQKLLAESGVASRRAAEELIRAGRVTVDGRVAQLGERADPSQHRIELDGEPVRASAPIYWVVNKPRGVLSTVRDPEGRPTVVDLVPRRDARVFPVGRLDRDTEGLVLMTNDGALTHALLHPSHEVEREYVVTVRGELGTSAQERLARGVRLEDGTTAPARVEQVRFEAATGETRFHLTLIEGRKRQIRRALASLGHPVRRLVRIRMGPLQLGRLESGAVRPLSPSEREALLRMRQRAGDPGDPDGSPHAQADGRSAAKGRPRKRKRRRRREPPP